MTNFFQKVIDILRYKYYYKNHFDTIYKKHLSLENNINKIQTLVLGSSHGHYAFLPKEETEFNLSIRSQDLYYSYKLYQKYASKLSNLKNIILFYSVFSPGFEIEKTSNRFLCIPYIFIYNIYSKSIVRNITFLIECIYRSIKFFNYESDIRKNIDKSYRGEPCNDEEMFKNASSELLMGGGSC